MPRKNRSEEKRKDILDAFGRCMINQPFEKISIRRIAAEADVPVGSINYYFDGKKDILLTYYEALLAGYRRRIHEWAIAVPEDISTFAELYANFMQLYERYADYESRYTHFGFLCYYNCLAQYSELAELSNRICDECAQEIVEGIGRTQFRCADPYRMAHILMAVWDGYSLYCEVAVNSQNRWDMLSYMSELIAPAP